MPEKVLPIKLDFSENPRGQRVAHFMNKGVHLTVAPHMTGYDGKEFSGWEVYFWGDKQGQPDTSHELQANVVPGKLEDQEEIVDTYARRLEAGVKPEDMFNDIIENNRRDMDKIAEEIQVGRMK